MVYATAVLLVLVGGGLGLLETGWAKNQIRSLIVRQANQYLTASLQIGRLEGSLLRGITLGDIRLARGAQPIVIIDEVSLSYSLRELWENGTVIRRLRLTRPRVFLDKDPEGRWNVGSLVRRSARQEQRSGPGRPIEIASIEVIDGAVTLGQPVAFGAAHIPTRYTGLDTTLAFRYEPVAWMLLFRHTSFRGADPMLDVASLTGTLGNGHRGWQFQNFAVRTTSSAFTLDGAAGGGHGIDLSVHASRFRFQEWSGIVHGLSRIGVAAKFDVQLRGPEERLETSIDLSGTGGSVKGALTLNTAVPGWHGRGAVDITRLDLARWLDRSDRPSDITGHVGFDLDLDLGGHFPRGRYRFDGARAAFMGYGADNVHAFGQLTATAAQIAGATAAAYGAAVTLDSGSAITLDEPYPFRFVGRVDGIDLRRLPRPVPVPHVESRMTFRYDVAGRFSDPYIAGRAEFGDSTFLGAGIAAGTTGTIDTSETPLHYGGEGDVSDVDVNRFGTGLDVGWMQDPRYAGRISGHFRVAGSGSDREAMALDAAGRISHAAIFHGTIDDADVAVGIHEATLTTALNGRFAGIDPAIAIGDPRFAAALSGTADVRTTVAGLLVRTPSLADYDIDGTVTLDRSTARGLVVDRLAAAGALRDGTLRLTSLDVSAPLLTGSGAGTIALDGSAATAFDYTLVRADLGQLPAAADRGMSGIVATKGRVSGPFAALRVAGSGSAAPIGGGSAAAASATLAYDVTIPSGDALAATGRLDAAASLLSVGRQPIDRATAIVTMNHGRIGVDARIERPGGRGASLLGDVLLHVPERRADLVNLTVTIGRTPWQLSRSDSETPSIRWVDEGVDVAPLEFVAGASRDEQIRVSGVWRRNGIVTARVGARHVFLETLEGVREGPAPYGGTLDLDGTLVGTTDHPLLNATFSVTSGRVHRLAFAKLAGQVAYANGSAAVDLRLDQSPGAWVTARGRVPRSLVDASAPDQPMDVAIASSAIDLGLLEGITDVVRNVNGRLQIDVAAIGTGRDPHFRGTIDLGGAAFQVTATGSRYRNGRAAIRLASDRIDVQAFHIEDAGGRPLDVHGSLGTHELRVGDLEIDGTAKRFEVLRNEFGRVDVDADVTLRGHFESPRIGGTITINGGDVRVDNILERALFQPYSTQSAPVAADVDPVAALNPWERLGFDLALHVPNTLRLLGDNVQVSTGTPIGLGNINLRVAGDLYLYKDPGQPLFVTGSFDSVSGTYNFQGRQFNVDPSSSINFRGDLNPELFVSVTREISGVQARVTINGPLRQPELHLSSTPPLDSSDILSLIVFNTTPNQLSTVQQQELAVRAGTLAAGFIATPIVSALQNEIGIDVLQIEPAGDIGTGPKITVGNELAPGLVARFSRQFGSEPYDEATIEYYLSRLLRLRATFSDAQSLEARSPFRRIERAGIDLIFFFSF